MKLAEQIKLSEVVRFLPYSKEKAGSGNFVVASETGVTEMDINALLAEYGAASDLRGDHILLGQAIVEPIMQAVPYLRWTNQFFQPVHYTALEDNTIPVEYYVTAAYQTGPDAEVFFLRPGIGWTRPTFVKWQTGVEIQWSVLERGGWPVLQRMLQRAAEHIARGIDRTAQYVLDTAVDGTAGQGSVVAGGTMTKAAVDAVIKAAATNGFPMKTGAINSGTLTDMTGWSGGPFYNASLPPEVAMQILQTLHLGQYGQVEWYASPFVPTNFVYFGGPAGTIGYEQTRGDGKNASDVDIRKQFDFHVIISPEYAFYCGNSLSVRRLKIVA